MREREGGRRGEGGAQTMVLEWNISLPTISQMVSCHFIHAFIDGVLPFHSSHDAMMHYDAIPFISKAPGVKVEA